jgi:hypothetical protein
MTASDVPSAATYPITMPAIRSCAAAATASDPVSTRAAVGVRHAVGSNPLSRHGPPICLSSCAGQWPLLPPIPDATRMPELARQAPSRKPPASGWAPRPPVGPPRGIHPPRRREPIRRKEGNARRPSDRDKATFRVDGTTCRARRVSWSSKWVGLYRGVSERPSTGSGWGTSSPSIDRDRHPGARDGGVLLCLERAIGQ